nr:gliding motility-associated C-terminal domain-containing protein [uncultured Lacibacter sp.]
MDNSRPFLIMATIAFLTLLHIQSYAQCSSNVLFYENFGGDLNSPLTGPRLPAGVTTYTFDSLGTIADGEYAIRKTTANIANGQPQYSTWHVGYDRSFSGNMMIVNADYTAGKFYETRVDNLCSGSQLYFSAWVANLLKAGVTDPLDPVLRFEIASAVTGNVLSDFVTPVIPRFGSFTWTKYGFNFSLPAGENSVILRIFNNQVGGLGNDLALDDIEFTLCGATIAPVVSGTMLNTNDACTGNNVSISTTISGGSYAAPAYQWQFNNGSGWNNIPGANSTSLTINNIQKSDSGNYRLLVAEAVNINSANCRSVSPSIPVHVFAPTPPLLYSNLPVCEAKDLLLVVPVDAIAYIWTINGNPLNLSSDTLRVRNVSAANNGKYHVRLITKGGCSSSDSAIVSIQTNTLQRMVPTDTLLCDAQTLFADAQQAAATSYLWNDGSTDPQRTITNTGTYSVRTSDAVCERIDSFIVSRTYTPTVQLPADTTLCVNEPLTVNAANPLADFYLWSNNVTDSSIIITNAGTYAVALGNACGVAVDEILVAYKDCADMIFVPNAFTPNGDRLNDVLFAKAFFRIEAFDFKIFNRWGQQIFITKDLFTGWDGRMNNQKAPAGQYTWLISYTRNGKLYKQKGTVLLIP